MCHRIKKGILVVSYGTSHINSIQTNIEVVENRIKKEFYKYEVRRAFTSETIINKLKEHENVHVDNPREALNKMIKNKFKEVIIQPLHIIAGTEYEKLSDIYNEYKDSFDRLSLGKPILHNITSCKEAVYALRTQLPEARNNCAVVLLGHGSTHLSNRYYSYLQSLFDEEKLNVIVETIENNTNIDNVIQKLKDNKVVEVILMPFLLVIGCHAERDIFSEHEGSWKTRLEEEGLLVDSFIHGLGENIEYQNIYVNRIYEVIRGIN